jgi:ABC-type transport system involved in multi-copper enzyme maturation permease subunit
VNRTIIIATFDRWLASPSRLALIFVLGAFPVLASFTGSGGRIATGSTTLLVIVLGAGIIGRDASAGVLPVLFARPVPRAHYVSSRWAALGFAGTAVAFVQILLAGAGALHSGGPTAADWALQFPRHLFTAFGVAAVLVLFSSLLNGFGDLGIYFSLLMIRVFLGTLAGVAGNRFLNAVAREISRFLAPGLDLHAVRVGGTGWFEVVSYFSTVTLALALAVIAMNRKEISYASD